VHIVRTETNTFKVDGENYCYSDHNGGSETTALSSEYYRKQCLEQIDRGGLDEKLGDNIDDQSQGQGYRTTLPCDTAQRSAQIDLETGRRTETTEQRWGGQEIRITSVRQGCGEGEGAV